MKRIFNLFIISLLIISLPVILKADNELLNSGFESGDLSSWGGGLANSQVGTGEVHGGTYSYQINGDLGGGFSALNQTINVTSGQVVTFHAYVKIDSFASAGDDAGIGLKLESVGMGIYEETKLDAVTAGWVEISVTATATADGTMSCMIFEWNAGNVVAFFDDLTAPDAGGSSPEPDTLQNGDFETGDLTHWDGGIANSQVESINPLNGTYSYHLNGDLGGAFSALSQNINVTNGQVITLSGYVKIDSFASAGDNAGIGLKLESVDMGIFEEAKLDAVTAGVVKLTVTATATADGTMSCMIFQYNAGIVDAYFDNITAPEDGGVDPVDTYDTMNVVVSIFEEIIGVDFIATEYNFGTVSAGTVNVSSDAASIISNSGTCNEIYSFQITDPSGWSSSTTAPGANTFVLSGALSINVSGITWSLANHALSTTLQICTGTRFAGDETGVGVASGALRHLWLQFMAPTSSTIYTAQTIPITVSAEAE